MKNILRNNKERRKLRVRRKVSGTMSTPRLAVFRSNKYIYAQLIDDVAGKTLVSVGDIINQTHEGKTKVEAAFTLGKALAARALEKKIKKAVFDRSSYKYHGRVKSLADGAREGGLSF